MDEIKTASWVETRYHMGEHPGTTRATIWLRMEPPARAWRDEIIEGGSGWSHHVRDARGFLSTASSWEKCTLTPETTPPTAEELLREVLAPPLSGNAQDSAPSKAGTE